MVTSTQRVTVPAGTPPGQTHAPLTPFSRGATRSAPCDGRGSGSVGAAGKCEDGRGQAAGAGQDRGGQDGDRGTAPTAGHTRHLHNPCRGQPPAATGSADPACWATAASTRISLSASATACSTEVLTALVRISQDSAEDDIQAWHVLAQSLRWLLTARLLLHVGVVAATLTEAYERYNEYSTFLR